MTSSTWREIRPGAGAMALPAVQPATLLWRDDVVTFGPPVRAVACTPSALSRRRRASHALIQSFKGSGHSATGCRLAGWDTAFLVNTISRGLPADWQRRRDGRPGQCRCKMFDRCLREPSARASHLSAWQILRIEPTYSHIQAGEVARWERS